MLLPGRLVEGIPLLDEGKSLVGDNGVELMDIETSVDSEVPGVVIDSVTESVDCVVIEGTGTGLEIGEVVVDSELPDIAEDSVTDSGDCVLVEYSVVDISLVTSADVTLPAIEDEEVAS